MCGRLTLQTETEQLSRFLASLNMPLFAGLEPRYNICPTQPVACIRQGPSSQLETAALRWGLVPFWAKDLKIGARMINARSETVADKPAFRAAFAARRCLIVADGFYEWKKAGKTKQPYYIARGDRKPFFMAGLWESWQDKNASDSEATDSEATQSVETCSVLTTEANELMRPLHDRMPVILDPPNLDFWLDNQFENRNKLQEILVPYAAGGLRAWPVSTLVNKPGNDNPRCIEPIKISRSLFPD